MKTTLEQYCQYLLNTQINYTCTNMADHVDGMSHDSVYRFLRSADLTPALVWEHVKEDVVLSPSGYIIFDDTVLEKVFSFKIEGVRKQYSGNKHAVIKGIGVVNCVYFNAEVGRYWVLDFRVFDPDRDGKTKVDHVFDMLKSLEDRAILYGFALMDSWYATAALMKYLHLNNKIYYCPIKSNRKVDESGGVHPYVPVSTLIWPEQDVEAGKIVKLHAFPLDTKVKLFRVAISTDRTEFIVTNDCFQSDLTQVRQQSAQRWKIEQVHREEKQLTGITKCECRKNRSQRNHICAAILVWLRLTKIAHQTRKTVYQLKKNLLDEYLTAQMVNPTIAFS